MRRKKIAEGRCRMASVVMVVERLEVRAVSWVGILAVWSRVPGLLLLWQY